MSVEPIRLGRLDLKNFRSYVKAGVTFPSKGMVLARGFNLDTNGSSRSGKSSLGLAIRYVLDAGFPLNVKDQKSWYAKGSTLVTLTLLRGQEVFEVSRGQQHVFTRPDGSKATGSEAVHRELEKLFGIPMSLLGLLINKKGVSSRDRFLWRPPAEKNDFLCQIIPGLTKLKELIKKSQELLGSPIKGGLEYDRQVAEFEWKKVSDSIKECVIEEPILVPVEPLIQELQTVEEILAAAQASEASLRAQVDEARKQKIEKTKEARALWDEKIRGANSIEDFSIPIPPELAAALKEGERRLQLLIEADQKKRDETNRERAFAEAKLSEISRLDGAIKQAKKEYETKQKYIESLKDNNCPSCHRPWPEGCSAAIHQHQHDLQELEDNLKDLFARQAERYDYEAKLTLLHHFEDPIIRGLRQTVANIKSQIDSCQSEQRTKTQEKLKAMAELSLEADAAVSAVSGAYEERLGQLQELYLKASQKVTEYKGKQYERHLGISAITAENKRKLDDVEKQRYRLLDLRRGLLEAQAKLDAIKSSIAAERDFIEMLKSFSTAIFDEILQEISDHTNTILASVANTASVSIRFSSETVSKTTGEAKQQISTLVTIDGNTADLESGASDGMISAIDLAVDRALALVVASRSNCHPGWVMLDECWENLDQVSKESCMEVLSRQAEDTLVMVVDHGSETKELFSKTIDIEFKAGISTIRETPSEA